LEDLTIKIYSLSALILTLILSFLLDRSFAILKRAAVGPDQYDPNTLVPRFAGDIVADLIFVPALLGLAWLVLTRFKRDILVAILYIAVGIIGVLYLPLVLIGPPGAADSLVTSAFGVMTRGFRATLMEIGFSSYFSMASAGIFIIGVLGLVRMGDYPPEKV
jgi:hypothetical protein